MNKLEKEFKHFCNKEQDTILVHPKEILDWINQNYISKEEILGLECLKEEVITPLHSSILRTGSEHDNELRRELKQQIIDYKNK